MSSSRYSLCSVVSLVASLVLLFACAQQEQADAVPDSASEAAADVVADSETDTDVGTPGLQAAVRLQDVFARVAADTLPSVAGVSAYRRAPGGAAAARLGWREASQQGHPGFDRIGQGSAFVVSDDGFLLTAHSLLRDSATGQLAQRIEVELQGERLEGRLVGAERSIDLAVLKVEPGDGVQPLSIATPGSVTVGHWAIAIGDPPGPGTVFATGSVSAVPERECYQEQRSATLLQSSARVPPGGYGGPLVNIRGEVIGISLPQPLGARTDFALPAELAMTIYEPLIARESMESPWIGISVRRLGSGPGATGILIDDVFDPSPASRADIRVGDILLHGGSQQISSVADFQRWLYLTGIGATVDLQVWREGIVSKRTVTIEERPESATMR